MAVGIVSGLRRELDCLDLQLYQRTFAGVGPDRAAAGARELVVAGATALVSYGVAGGLAGDVPAGTVVLATGVIHDERTFETDAPWRERLRMALASELNVVEGVMAGVDRMVPSPAAKGELHVQTSALACDMESHAVAQVAVELGVPFVVVRAISDPAGQDVPKWVLRCVTPDGDVNIKPLLLALARRPWNLPVLMRLARESKLAFASLRGVARLAGPGFGR
jgi:adenosylhomocysteine nucleosidase